VVTESCPKSFWDRLHAACRGEKPVLKQEVDTALEDQELKVCADAAAAKPEPIALDVGCRASPLQPFAGYCNMHVLNCPPLFWGKLYTSFQSCHRLRETNPAMHAPIADSVPVGASQKHDTFAEPVVLPLCSMRLHQSDNSVPTTEGLVELFFDVPYESIDHEAFCEELFVAFLISGVPEEVADQVKMVLRGARGNVIVQLRAPDAPVLQMLRSMIVRARIEVMGHLCQVLAPKELPQVAVELKSPGTMSATQHITDVVDEFMLEEARAHEKAKTAEADAIESAADAVARFMAEEPGRFEKM
jgi:hypothetical protein